MKKKDMLYALWTQTHDDTGWMNLVSSSDKIRYRKKNGVVYVVVESLPRPTVQLIGTLPEGYRPSRNITIALRTNQAQAVAGWIEPNGAIKVDASMIPTSASNIAGTLVFPAQ